MNKPENIERYKKINKENSNKPECKEKHRQILLNGQAVYMNRFIKNPSKPQKKLYKMILSLCPYAIMNYPCLNYSIDIAIPFLNIAIEYDEPYWHQNIERDKVRQYNIEKEGWKFIRYNKLPTLQDLKEVTK